MEFSPVGSEPVRRKTSLSLRAFAFLLLVFAAYSAAGPVMAQQVQGERITGFSSDITIGQDGTLTVREAISVNAQGDQIRRGIFRDFPTTYVDRLGNTHRVSFEVQRVTRNGRDEPYVLENIENGRRVRIGSADVFLDPGIHVYTITYTTSRQIGFFEDHDELYWNVTPLDSLFVIDSAEAVIHLPGSNIEDFDYFTGPYGSQAKNATATRLSADSVRFNTTAPLAPGEGLTAVVSFPKGVVTPPSAVEETSDFLRNNGATGAALLGLIGLFLYYYYVWYKVGRDPARGVIIPLFAPPEGFSAAAIRFVYRMGYDRKAFAAALISMAVKGFIRISEEDSDYTLIRTEKNADEANLSKGERAIADKLFAGRNEITLKNSNHSTISKSITALQDALRDEDENVYFVTNRGWFYLGLLILLGSAIVTVLFSGNPGVAGFLLVWVSGWTAGTSALVYRAVEKWRGVRVSGGSRILDVAGALFATIFAAPFVFFLIMGLVFVGGFLPVLAAAALVLQGILAFVFYRLLKAPTKAGAKVRDEIEGFWMFLTTAEKHRLEVLHPPDVTPEIFEKFLPYAIALDAENAWSRKFQSEIAEAGQAATRKSYVPLWYSGRSFDRLGTTGFVSSIGSAVASATAAAATAPGKSSGMGGGGFSGGGGGGGGVGGW